jgi:hypothetical protein
MRRRTTLSSLAPIDAMCEQRIAACHAAVEAHADLDTLLPADARFPRIHSRLTDGRLSPASVVLGGAPGDDDDDDDRPAAHLLFDLDDLPRTRL